MSPYVILATVAAFATGGVTAAGIMQLTVSTQVTCAVAQSDPPKLPNTLFQTQPMPSHFKSW